MLSHIIFYLIWSFQQNLMIFSRYGPKTWFLLTFSWHLTKKAISTDIYWLYWFYWLDWRISWKIINVEMKSVTDDSANAYHTFVKIPCQWKWHRIVLKILSFFALSNFPNSKFEGGTGERSYPQRGSYRNRYFLKLHVKADPPGIPHRVIPKIVIGDFTWIPRLNSEANRLTGTQTDTCMDP